MELKDDLQLGPAHREILVSLFDRFLPGRAVWAYGSRFTGAARPFTDLDLIVFAGEKDRNLIAELEDALEASSLPFRVEIFIWNDIPETFRDGVREGHVELIPAGRPG